jgi:signal transduction histidine kinase/ligand-binding sensor domain-containing protein/DNA-binding response OmpR family regulator
MKFKYLYIIFFSLFISYSYAQPNVQFNHINIINGLSQATVFDIVQDDNGLIWIATRDGLNRFDGYEFKLYKNELRNPKTISNNHIQKIYKDKFGVLWFGTDKGLNRFNEETETFERFYYEPSRKDWLGSDNIRDIQEDKAGNLWIATAEKGLFKVLFKGTGKRRIVIGFQAFSTGTASSDLKNSSIRDLYLDAKNRFWIATDNGLHLIKSIEGKQLILESYHTNNSDIPSNSINSLTLDKRGNLWLGTWGDGLVKMYWQNGKARFQQFLPNQKNSIKDAYIICLDTDKNGNVWVGNWTNGLDRIQQDTRGKVTFTNFSNDPTNIKSIAHNSIRSIFQDNDDVIWVGTYGNGISKIDPSASKFLHVFRDIHESKSISGNDVWAISEDNFGTLWVGTWVGGLNRTDDLDSKKFKQYNTKQFPNFTDDKITNLLLDSKGRFWVGTWGKGVFQVKFNDNGTVAKFENVPINYEKPNKNYNSFNNINKIYEDRKGNIWLATYKGVHLLKGNVFEYIDFYVDEKEPESMSDEDVQTLLEDSKGNFWIGTAGNGLYRIEINKVLANPTDSIFLKHYRYNPNNLLGLSSENIQIIFEDSKGHLWLGTNGAGLNLYDYSSDDFSTLTEVNDLPNNVINGILEDENGALWLSTNKGVSKFDTEEKTFENYDILDGLQSNEFIKHSAYRSDLNMMYFGGINGFNVFHPEKIITNKRPPKVIFTEFQILNKKVDFTAENSPIDKPIQFVDKIELKYSDNVVTFEFAALNYTDPSSNQYQYRLEGFNEVWQKIDQERRVTFINLTPGAYTLKVKGANFDGIWNKVPTSIELVILPPFWQTWWFRLGAIILAILGIIAIIRFRVKKVKRQNEKLERIVTERTEEIRQQKRLIEERSKYKEQFFSNVSHELRTPLNGILGISHLLAKTELSGTQQQFTNAIKTSADNLLVIVNDLLDVSKLNEGQLELIQKPFDTIKLFSTLYELFRVKTDEKNLRLQFDLDKSIPQYLKGDQVRFYQILINLLGNAVKFTAEGRIHLTIDLEAEKDDKNWLSIRVEDTGIGIPKDKIGNIFNDFTQVIDEKGYHYEGTGLGLTIVQNLVELQGGTVKVESEVHQGTVFSVLLPFGIPTDEEIDEVLQEEQTQVFKRKWEGKKVLLIEDNVINQLYAKNLFIEWQLNADYAMNVKEAETLSEANEYDCILADVKLPDGDGIQFVREMRHNANHINKNTPVIVLTAGTSAEQRSRTKGLNIFSYMTKPFNPDNLIHTLNHVFLKQGNEIPNLKEKITEKPEQDTAYLSGLKRLVKNNNRHIIKILEVYINQAPIAINKMNIAVEEEDYEMLYFETHKLLSSVRTLGLKELIAAVEKLNNATKSVKDFETLAKLKEDLLKENAKHLPRLEKELKDLKAKVEKYNPGMV